jgi:hypothetical protein
MTPRNLLTLTRPLVALVCSLALALPSAARASEPDAPAEPPTDELNAQAQQHVIKAYQQYQNKAYATAEAELRRAAFYAPRWRPLHFNLAVMAEAQGKLGTAVREYKAFQPFASSDESMVAEQRIVELDARRRKIAGSYKKQIAVGAITLSVGLAATGGGIGVLVYGARLDEKTTKTEPTGIPDNMDTPEVDESVMMTEVTNAQRKPLITAGYLVGFVGLLVLVYSVVPLRNAVKAKRQLDGLALGPTRLRLGTGGVSLRF